jgi:membrane protein
VSRNLLYKGIRTASRMREPYYQGKAAEVAFYLLFSILPIVLILTKMLMIFEISPDIITDIVSEYAASEYTDVIVDFISAGPSMKVTALFVCVALWAASKSQFSLIRIANYTYQQEGSETIGYLKTRLRAILTEIVFIALIVASLGVLVFGEAIFLFIQSVFSEYLNVEIQISRIWLYLRWPVAFIAYMGCIAVNYSVLLHKRLRIKQTLPGTLFASVMILLATLIYSIYLEKFSAYTVLYGGLASIIALMLWFYIISSILVTGIIINVVWFEDPVEDDLL